MAFLTPHFSLPWWFMSTDSPRSPARAAGILLHPASLPGPYGIGDLGSTAYRWVDALARAGQKWWQILPLGPTGYGDSPYQSFSTFAGNPNLLSPELLLQDGLLQRPDLEAAHFPADRIDYGPVIQYKIRILSKAWQRFQAGGAPALRPQLDEFNAQHAHWLDDFALFMALKNAQTGAGWQQWPRDLVEREPGAIHRARQELTDAVGRYKLGQFLFFRQWKALKRYANERGIRILGDMPIFVSPDSADVWSNPHLFLLDERRQPKVVAGVPPDYFSATGQLWGNPLYDWQALKQTGYAWWVDRLRATLELVDLVRLDHFRAFEAYWEVPAGMPTAQVGHWVKGPGTDLFDTLRRALGGLPLTAEDLGLITKEVEELRDKLGLPGMRVLQFAFGEGSDHAFLPHNYERQTVVYTGTHDNDTTRGWYASAPEKVRDHVRRYLARDARDIAWDFIRLAWSSVADYAIAPLQDVLDLGPEARMNFPGRGAGNWCWRFTEAMLSPATLDRLGDLTRLYGR
jgi:4-alpha-glucanotransferase